MRRLQSNVLNSGKVRVIRSTPFCGCRVLIISDRVPISLIVFHFARRCTGVPIGAWIAVRVAVDLALGRGDNYVACDDARERHEERQPKAR